MLIRRVLVVWKMMGKDSDGILRHDEWLEGGILMCIQWGWFGIGGFPFLLSLLVLLYSKAIDNFETASTLVLSLISRYELRALLSRLWYHILFPISPTPDPARYTSTLDNVARPKSIGPCKTVEIPVSISSPIMNTYFVMGAWIQGHSRQYGVDIYGNSP